MRKWIAPSIVCWLFVFVLLMPSSLVGAQGQNLLSNPGFEKPFQTLDGVPPRQVAQGWSPWHISGGASASENIQPEYYPASDTTNGLGVPRIRGGSDAQQYQTFFATHDGGVFQRVNGVTTGSQITFTTYVYVWSSSFDDVNKSELDGGVVIQVGIDPTGGTDASSTNIVWSQPSVQYDAYNQYTVTASSQGTAVTVFVRSTVSTPVKNTSIYIDDASLTLASSGSATATSSPIPLPSATNTQPPTPTQQVEATSTTDTSVVPSSTPVPPTATQPVPTQEPTAAPTEIPPTAVPSATSTQVPTVQSPPPASATPTQESIVVSPTATPIPPTQTNIPPTPVGGFQSNITHIVQTGDTVGNLASLYGSDIDAIISANGLSSSAFIRVGQTLLIPVRQPPVIPATPTPSPIAPPESTAVPPTNPGNPSQTFVYVVQPGDTLLRIAVRFSTNVVTLSQLNGIANPNLIRVGQRLLIPTGSTGNDVSGTGSTSQPIPPTETKTYTVRPGDTLFRIALRNQRTVAQMMQANNLNNPNFIFVGQVLVIP